MKLAVTGKGGVGKTTIAAGLARHYGERGRKVIAIDADADANLASALGVDGGEVSRITPIAEMEELVAERTGAQPGQMGGFFKLNPEVEDLPEKFSHQVHGVRLMVMGTVRQGGAGCLCPESALVKTLMRHLMVQRDDLVVADMEAGIEHLGRGIAESVDALLVVVEPGGRSIQTARTIKGLAADLGLKRVFAVLSRVKNAGEEAWLREELEWEFPVLGAVHESDDIREADRRGMSPYDVDGGFVKEIEALASSLEKELVKQETAGQNV